MSTKKQKKSLFTLSEFQLNSNWFAENYPNATLALQSGQVESYEAYYESIENQKHCSPSPYFCSSYYARNSHYNERQPEWGLIEDYLRYGAPRMLSPHWLFDERYFFEIQPNIRQVFDTGNLVSAYQYFIRHFAINEKIARPSPLFNKAYYLTQLERQPIRDAFYDFIAYGHIQGLSCTPLFDTDWYGSRYPDLKIALGADTHFKSLLQHFAEYGLAEGRIPFPDLDLDYYLHTYPDVAEGNQIGINPVYHFLFWGIQEGRRPNRFFDTTYYLEHNPQVVQELKSTKYLGPFEHFLMVGIKKNLKACAPLVTMSISDDTAKSLYEKRCRIEAAAVKAGRKIQFPEVNNPCLSIIIPVVNHFNFTANLLVQLELLTKANPALAIEIIVVDNGSSDATVNLNNYVSGSIKILRFEQAMGYPRACNTGVKASKGRLLLFLNNDIEIPAGSIEQTIHILTSSPDIGAVGGKIIKLNGELQEAGGIVWNDGSTCGYGRGDDPLSPRYLFQRDVDYCSGCFLGVDAALFKQIGLFDEQFSPGYYEETDLCARIWQTGRRVVYDPNIAIFHYEYASYSKSRPETISLGLMARNREKFIRKNLAFIATRPVCAKANIDSAADRGVRNIKRVLFIEDIIPRREIGSGFCRSEDTVRQFLDAGWWVTIWANEKRAGVEPLDELFCDVIYAQDYTGGLTTFLLESANRVDLVWVCRTHNLGNYESIISQWRSKKPQQRKVVSDTEAIASVRHWLVKELAREKASPDLTKIDTQISLNQLTTELKGYLSVDTFVAVSELDSRLIRLITPSTPVEILGHQMPIKTSPKSFKERQDLLFCGAIHEANAPNYDSLVWFANRVLPLLKQKLPELKLKIVGYWRASVPIPSALNDENIIFIGSVADLAPYFAEARLFIAPTRFAAGIPHKVHEAMSFGLPSVLTPILASQLAEFGTMNKPAFFTAEDFSASAFAEAIISAYTDEKKWQQVRENALISLDKYCSKEKFSTNFQQILTTVMGINK